MATRIDHFMYAVPSLDEGMTWAADLFGTEPVYGGEHVGLGTRNALLSLGSTYLEIIAPDPAQDVSGTLGERFAGLAEGGLVTWAAEGDLNAISRALRECGVETVRPSRTQRQTAEGTLLVWDLLFPAATAHGPRMPFFIDWLECPNPRDTSPSGGEFRSLAISTPDGEELQRALDAIGLNLDVSAGEPALAVTVETAKGDVVLSSTSATSTMAMR